MMCEEDRWINALIKRHYKAQGNRTPTQQAEWETAFDEVPLGSWLAAFVKGLTPGQAYNEWAGARVLATVKGS